MLCNDDPIAAVAALAEAREQGEAVALALSAQSVTEGCGIDFLAHVRELHPLAKRG